MNLGAYDDTHVCPRCDKRVADGAHTCVPKSRPSASPPIQNFASKQDTVPPAAIPPEPTPSDDGFASLSPNPEETDRPGTWDDEDESTAATSPELDKALDRFDLVARRAVSNHNKDELAAARAEVTRLFADSQARIKELVVNFHATTYENQELQRELDSLRQRVMTPTQVDAFLNFYFDGNDSITLSILAKKLSGRASSRNEEGGKWRRPVSTQGDTAQ